MPKNLYTCTKFQLWPFRPEIIKGNIKFKMADFGPNKVFCPNFQIVISQEPLVFGAEIFSFHAMFQWYLWCKNEEILRGGKGVHALNDLICDVELPRRVNPWNIWAVNIYRKKKYTSIVRKVLKSAFYLANKIATQTNDDPLLWLRSPNTLHIIHLFLIFLYTMFM